MIRIPDTAIAYGRRRASLKSQSIASVALTHSVDETMQLMQLLPAASFCLVLKALIAPSTDAAHRKSAGLRLHQKGAADPYLITALARSTAPAEVR